MTICTEYTVYPLNMAISEIQIISVILFRKCGLNIWSLNAANYSTEVGGL